MNVLFVCTGNTCRSPMAEHLLRKMAVDANIRGLTVTSAGVAPAYQLEFPVEAAEALKAEGVTGVLHKPQGLTTELVTQANVILAMEDRHRDIIAGRFPKAASKIKVLNIADPYGGTLQDYQAALAGIKTALTDFVRQWKS